MISALPAQAVAAEVSAPKYIKPGFLDWNHNTLDYPMHQEVYLTGENRFKDGQWFYYVIFNDGTDGWVEEWRLDPLTYQRPMFVENDFAVYRDGTDKSVLQIGAFHRWSEQGYFYDGRRVDTGAFVADIAESRIRFKTAIEGVVGPMS